MTVWTATENAIAVERGLRPIRCDACGELFRPGDTFVSRNRDVKLSDGSEAHEKFVAHSRCSGVEDR